MSIWWHNRAKSTPTTISSISVAWWLALVVVGVLVTAIVAMLR